LVGLPGLEKRFEAIAGRLGFEQGKTWQFLRGRDFLAKVHGRQGGAPEDWQEPTPEARKTLLPEDFVTCLAENDDGSIWVGFRMQGLALLDRKTRQVTLHATKKSHGLPDDFVSSILSVPGKLPTVGTYGGGVSKPAGGAGAAKESKTAPPLPSPSKPPTMAEVNALLKHLEPPREASQSSVLPLADDWRSQGNWMDRHGNFLAILCGMNFSTIRGYRKNEVTWGYGIGPHCKPGDAVRHWIHWLHSDNPCVLQNPEDGGRRQGEWNDHDDTGYPFNWDGPHVYCTLKVPAGRYVLSCYFFNKDGHNGMNRFRDYLVEVKPTALPDKAFADRSGIGVKVHAIFGKQPAGAVSRVGPSFWGGVYKRFYLEAAEPSVWTVRVNRQHSFNTIISGLFLDAVDAPWGPVEPPPARKPRFADPGSGAAARPSTARS
jgi:hypothetical protein